MGTSNVSTIRMLKKGHQCSKQNPQRYPHAHEDRRIVEVDAGQEDRWKIEVDVYHEDGKREHRREEKDQGHPCNLP
uniref:Uncharacterized protein n=1 Tax=Cucumis melo TaxID=3656 RepID=A0A9I9DUE0_CUCME